MVPAMAIGVAVGMRSPLVAIFLIPELLGDYALVLPVAAVVGVAWLLDRGSRSLHTVDRRGHPVRHLRRGRVSPRRGRRLRRGTCRELRTFRRRLANKPLGGDGA